MSITFNADEVFEMAEQIERNAAKFYRSAAGRTSDKQIKNMLLNMAAMEDGHLHIFQQMREQLGAEEKEVTVFDPDNEAAMYLRTMADARSREGRISQAKELTGRESIGEVLQVAIDGEKESVVFYTGLKSIVPPEAGRDKIEKIIAEELSHITALVKQLKAIGTR